MWNWANQGWGSAKHRGEGRIMKLSERKAKNWKDGDDRS